MDPESSVVLIRLAQDGDRQALNRLLARYLPRLRAWASRRLPHHARDLADTDDLVQDALIRTLKNLPAFDYRGEGALHAYLRKAVMNRLRDEVRRSTHRPEHTDVAENIEDRGSSPLEAAIGRESIERYEAALERLPDVDRQAVIMRLEFGCSFQEIAEAVGKPTPDAARVAVSRAVTRVATLMSETDPAGSLPGTPAQPAPPRE